MNIYQKIKKHAGKQTHDSNIVKKDLEDGVQAEAHKDGTIAVDKSVDLNTKKGKEIVDNEKVHLEQMKRGDLNYDNKYVYWKGKTFLRSEINEGSKELPWEKEAYNRTENT